jgi:hypothetical protein
MRRARVGVDDLENRDVGPGVAREPRGESEAAAVVVRVPIAREVPTIRIACTRKIDSGLWSKAAITGRVEPRVGDATPKAWQRAGPGASVVNAPEAMAACRCAAPCASSDLAIVIPSKEAPDVPFPSTRSIRRQRAGDRGRPRAPRALRCHGRRA